VTSGRVARTRDDGEIQIRSAWRGGAEGNPPPWFTRQDYYLPPEFAAPRRCYATPGISVTRDGVDHSEDVPLAARNALLNTIDHLTGRGWTPQQAYAICSVAVDLKISQVVDVPNMLVSAFLPEDTFTGS
jgi:formamidase